jgi:3-oxoacyl-[acyl-carrier protein] reductase
MKAHNNVLFFVIFVIFVPSWRTTSWLSGESHDMFDLTGKIAIVTGASRGIGRGIATLLASRGAVIVAAARGENAAATVAEITSVGGRAELASVDVTDTASVDALVSGTLARHSRVDILVNNAGIAKDQLMLRMKRVDWDAVLSTNLTSAFTCSQAVLRPMIKQRSGRIIMISSVVGQMGNAGQANYAASKAGLIGFTKSLAREVASRNITVNAIAPGMIDTEMIQTMGDKAREQWAASIPLGRPGTVADVAAAVCFLASDEAGYITGQVLAVNGGMYM